MTDVREVLGSALVAEPPTTVDAYAALTTGRRRRTRRYRWLAGSVTTALVVGVGTVVVLPRAGTDLVTPDPTTTASTARADVVQRAVDWLESDAAGRGTGFSARPVTVEDDSRDAFVFMVGAPPTVSESVTPMQVEVRLVPSGVGGSALDDCHDDCDVRETVADGPGGYTQRVAGWLDPESGAPGWRDGRILLALERKYASGSHVEIVGVAYVPAAATVAMGVPLDRTGIAALADVIGDPATLAGPDPSPQRPALEWVPTSPSAGTGFDLDVPRTLANLDGATDRIQELLGLDAVAPAEPYHVDTTYGAVQLAYRTADGTEVHVVITGGMTASATARCAAPIGSSATAPPVHWPEWSPGNRPMGSATCDYGYAVTTTRAGGDRLDRTVAHDVERFARGGVAVTVTADESAPQPVTVETVARVVDSLVPSVVFVEVTPGIEPPDLKWVRTEPTRSGPGVLDLDRALKLLGGEIDRIQDVLGVHAVERARPADLPVERGALQLNYRATGDVEVQVLVVAADEATEQSAERNCTYPPPPGPSDWPTDLSGKRPVIPHSPLCLEEPRVAVFDAGDGRLARTVVEYGDPPLGMLVLTVVSDASAPAPVTLEAAEETLLWIHSLAW